MKIWQLLDRPEKWTQGTFARDDKGDPIDLDDPGACCFCMLGAKWRCYPGVEEADEVNVILAATLNIHERKLSKWNDAPERTYEEVWTLCRELDV